jgi:hypothetical protein
VQARKFIYMDEVEAIYHRILERGDCLSLKTLAVTGDDLIAAGIPRGRRIGEILGMLFDRVLKDPSANEKDVLLAMDMTREKLRELDGWDGITVVAVLPGQYVLASMYADQEDCIYAA